MHAAKRIILILWIILWLVFSFRENKPGQFKELRYLYAHRDYTDKVSFILGKGLYDFLVFCRDSIPAGSTYEIGEFQYADIKEVQAKYFLWPLKVDADSPDFKILYKTALKPIRGYTLYRKFDDLSFILIKKAVE